MIKLYNGQVITPSGIKPGGVMMNAGKIVEVFEGDIEVSQATETVDCGGNYIAPGVIDIHIHGGGGCDFMEATPEAFITIAETHARYGMTSLYATTACCPNETIFRVLDACECVRSIPHNGANILGVHLEGNYLNPRYKGGQNPDFLFTPNPTEYEQIANHSTAIKRWSISPELPGALEMANYITRRGIVASIAHTEADHLTMLKAVNAGFSHVTHLYNAMSGIHKEREFKRSGVVESAYLIDDLTVEVIADGVHNPATLLQFAHKFKGVERTALTTDAMACAGVEGLTSFYNGRVIIEDGVGKLADRSALASSIATADRLIRVMVKQANVSLVDAVRMSSETPAAIMGIGNRKGALKQGYDADVIIFNEEIEMQHTFVMGRCVY